MRGRPEPLSCARGPILCHDACMTLAARAPEPAVGYARVSRIASGSLPRYHHIMNKYLKKARNLAIWALANNVSKQTALDVFKQLSLRFHVDAVEVPGAAGRIIGAPFDLVMSSYVRDRAYCQTFVDLITHRLLQGRPGTFLDIGANIGLVTVPVARDSIARVHAFEPEPRNFDFLSRNVQANGLAERVTLHHAALVAEGGVVPFELSEDNLGDHRIRRPHRLPRDKFNEAARQVIEVSGCRLDDLVEAEALPRPLVVKMDVQGAELEVVRGGRAVFERCDYLLTEYCPYLILRAGAEPEDFLHFMEGFPFAAVIGDEPPGAISLLPTAKVLPRIAAISTDGSATRFIDILLAREPGLSA